MNLIVLVPPLCMIAVYLAYCGYKLDQIVRALEEIAKKMSGL